MMHEERRSWTLHARRQRAWPRRPLVLRTALAMALLAGACAGAHAQDTPLQTGPQPRPADPTPAPPPPPAAAEEVVIDDGATFPVSRFDLRYTREHEGRPPIEDLMALEVALGITEEGVFVAPRDGLEEYRARIDEILFPDDEAPQFSVSAINVIGMRVVRELNARGIVGVLVTPHPEEILQIGPGEYEDIREDSRTLTLEVWTRSVQDLRTLGAGGRWTGPERSGDKPSAATRINHRVHERIRNNSPLRPHATDESGEVLRKDDLDDYLFRLNRHPGRRVDAAIASSDSPGDVILDYIVTENRPWTLYFQLSNTGTEQTDEWRQRLGFVHTQLTNRDDVLSIDFITAALDDANALIASYEFPFLHERVRLRGYGSWSEFTASDVGFADQEFRGDSWTAGGEIIANVFQYRRAFVDLFGGARYENHHIINDVVDIEGEEPFFLPYVGLRFERSGLLANTSASARVEWLLPDVAGTDSDNLDRLGRLVVDDDWVLLKWDWTHSFYLEPLLMGEAWSDPATPARKSTMAHEIALSLRGQHAFDNRLIPQHQETVGGMYSVRGYDESIVAGDDALIGTVEYRFHLPRIFAVQEDPTQTPLFGRPFRFSRDQRFGRPDWDLIFRGFFDYGRVSNSRRQTFEENETLMGAGVGVELIVGRHLDVRVDWGFALEDVRDVDSGDDRIHVVATILF